MFGLNLVKKQKVHAVVQLRLARHSQHRVQPNTGMQVKARQMNELRQWAFERTIP
jgi:hypothetical protein